MRSFRVSARLAALVSAGLAATCLAAFPPAHAAGASISGTVTGPAGGAPVDNVEVQAYTLQGGSWARDDKTPAVNTNAAGEYTIAVPAAGTYVLKFVDLNGQLIYEYYTSKAADAAKPVDGEALAVTDGASLTGKNVALVQGGSVIGQVLGSPDIDADRNNIKDNNGVHAVLASVVDATTGASLVDDYADDAVSNLGKFRVGALRPGKYKLYFNAYYTYTYASEFYQGAQILAEGTTVEITGANDTNVGAVTLKVSSSISGRVLQPNGDPAPATDVYVRRRNADQTWETRWYWGTKSDPLGSNGALKGYYVVSGLPEGSYQVCARITDKQIYCYDDATGEAAATIFPLTAGVPATQRDIYLGKKLPASSTPAPTQPSAPAQPVAQPQPQVPPVAPTPAASAPATAKPTAAATPTATPTLPPALPPATVDSVQLQKAPEVKGKLSVGAKVWVAKFSFVPANAKVSYRWFANNKRIKKANKWVLRLTPAQRRKSIKVRVVVSYPGMKSVTRTMKFKGKVR